MVLTSFAEKKQKKRKKKTMTPFVRRGDIIKL
jgi:hypothetical protein